MSAYEAADTGYRDEGPAGGSAWFAARAGAAAAGAEPAPAGGSAGDVFDDSAYAVDASGSASIGGAAQSAAAGLAGDVFDDSAYAIGAPGSASIGGAAQSAAAGLAGDLFDDSAFAVGAIGAAGAQTGAPVGGGAGFAIGDSPLLTTAALDGNVFGDPAYDGPGEFFLDTVFGDVPAGPAFDSAARPRADDGGALRLAVLSAGLGQPSTARILADRLADATRARLGERGRTVVVETLELRDLALDIAGAMVAGFPGAKLRAALDAVEGADGLIAVSPIYTASYSGLFKSFFDVLDKDGLTGKPTLIAATGGTARHSLALDHSLRPMFAYLRAFVVPTAVFAASEDWASAGGEGLNERVERAGGELAGLMAGAPAAARKPRDEFEDVVPFEQRMAALRAGL